MSRVVVIAWALWLILGATARAQDESTPHHMTKSDGELNMEACGVCHNEDLTLQRSKLETCTLCHSQTLHAGSDEHLRAAPAAVKAALDARPKDAPALPVSEDGHMFCGTCHIFHDPKVMSEDWLAHGWLPPDTGVSAAVRQAVLDRWSALAAKAEDKAALGSFATKGARQMRLPVDGGQLCRQCHGALR